MVLTKQADIAHGYQQINSNPIHMDAGKTISSSRELLREAYHATLDRRGAIEASGINPELVTVEIINRSKVTVR
ncbi:MAG TPA: hypothetical protein VLE21_01510 [Candidatus Nitrosocosmicus sp.]|nr:hypothetical protein [Candidatus Nitrosocosmicus sp.]